MRWSKETLMTSALLVLISATLLGLQVALGTNTLFHADSWRVEKREKLFGLTGSDEFLSTRAPLKHGRLDLGSWYGFQSVRSPQMEDIQNVRLKFSIDKGEYLSVRMNDSSYTTIGIVFSNEETKKPNLFFGKEKFQRNPFAQSKLEKWNKLEIELFERDMIFKLNGKEAARHKISGPFNFSSVTLHSGLKGALIDDFVMESEKGQIFRDEFSNIKTALKLFFFWFLALVALKMSVLAFVPGVNIRIAQFVFFIVIICQSIYYLSDRFFFSTKEISPFSKTLNGESISTFSNKIEKFRWGLMHVLSINSPSDIPSVDYLAKKSYPKERIWAGPIVCSSGICQKRRLETATQIISRSQSKMVLIGTSQSIGAGATHIDKTMFSIINNRLQKTLKNNRLVSLNLSESGSNPKLLFEKYSMTLELLAPEIVIINLTNNGDDESYFSGMKMLMDLVKRKSARVFVIQEAISSEAEDLLKKRRDFLNSLAGDKVHLLDLNLHMNADHEYAGDFRFWDFVHFNDLGHERAGNWVADEIMKVMSGK